MGNGVTDYIDEHSGTLSSALNTLASMKLEKLAEKAGGATDVVGHVATKLVDPAVWVITGKAPDGIDVGLYLAGFGGTLAGAASAVTGLAKAWVDDETQKRLNQIRSSEPSLYRSGIKACVDYQWFSAGQQAEAILIARHGGTVWLHPNGLAVYIHDAKGHLVCDYHPSIYQSMWTPAMPLRPVGKGLYKILTY